MTFVAISLGSLKNALIKSLAASLTLANTKNCRLLTLPGYFTVRSGCGKSLPDHNIGKKKYKNLFKSEIAMPRIPVDVNAGSESALVPHWGFEIDVGKYK